MGKNSSLKYDIASVIQEHEPGMADTLLVLSKLTARYAEELRNFDFEPCDHERTVTLKHGWLSMCIKCGLVRKDMIWQDRKGSIDAIVLVLSNLRFEARIMPLPKSRHSGCYNCLKAPLLPEFAIEVALSDGEMRLFCSWACLKQHTELCCRE